MTLALLQDEIRTILRRVDPEPAPERLHKRDPVLEALAPAYPALRQLFGGQGFAWLAARFARRTSAAGRPWREICAGLPGFMIAEPALRPLPHIADLAALEWGMHSALIAPMAPRLDGSQLAAVATDRLSELRLRRQSGWSLFTSPYPVLDIWRVCQADDGKHVVVEFCGEPTRLLIGRAGSRVIWMQLSYPQLDVLRQLEAGGSLYDATCRLSAAERAHVFAFLAGLLDRGAFTQLDEGRERSTLRGPAHAVSRPRTRLVTSFKPPSLMALPV